MESLVATEQIDLSQEPWAERYIEGVERGLLEAEPFARFQNKPEGFSRDILKEILWSKLIEIAQSVWRNKRTAVQSCANVGKTFVAGSIAVAWLNLFPKSCKVITTAAPPERQIKELLWGEIRAKYRRALARGINLVGGEPGTMDIWAGDEWWAKGFTIPSSGTPEERKAKFHGHHAEHVLIIVDECHGVPSEVLDAIEDMMTGFHCHLLLLSNPMAPSGPFYNAVRSGQYNVIRISAFDHPNVIEDRPVIPGAVSREAVQEAIDKMTRPLFEGEEPDAECFQVPWTREWRKVIKPAFFYRFLGQFPSQAENAVIPLSAVQDAMERWKRRAAEEGDAPPEGIRPIGGQDVAEFGGDLNVLALRYDYWTAPLRRWSGMDPIETAKRSARELEGKDAEDIFVDGTGVGAGVAPDLKKNHGLPAHTVKVAEAPTARAEEGEFAQLRDQLWWAGREYLLTETNAMLPPDDDLMAQLVAPMYDFNLRNRIKVTPKKELRKTLGRSTDDADSWLLTHAPKKRAQVFL